MFAIACYALHYGAEYLAWSVRSIQDAVDEIHVFYTERPSFGFGAGLRCPDDERTLHEQAQRFANKQVHWHKGAWGSEGSHRQAFLDKARELGADLVLVVDADEVWPVGSAEAALRYVHDRNCAGRWLARFQNFWRSFRYELHDGFRPIRIVDMRHSLRTDEQLEPAQTDPIYHFGYAQSETIMRYKWTCHGHQAEYRPSWLENKFLVWTPGTHDLHPVVNNLWEQAYPVEPNVEHVLDRIVGDHPYRHLEIIR